MPSTTPTKPSVPPLAIGQMVTIVSGTKNEQYWGEMGAILGHHGSNKFLVQLLKGQQPQQQNGKSRGPIQLFLSQRHLKPMYLASTTPTAAAADGQDEATASRKNRIERSKKSQRMNEAKNHAPPPQETLHLSPSPSNVSSITEPPISAVNSASHLHTVKEASKDDVQQPTKSDNDEHNTSSAIRKFYKGPPHVLEPGHGIRVVGGTYMGERAQVVDIRPRKILVRLEQSQQEVVMMQNNIGAWERSAALSVLKERRRRHQQQQQHPTISNGSVEDHPSVDGTMTCPEESFGTPPHSPNPGSNDRTVTSPLRSFWGKHDTKGKEHESTTASATASATMSDTSEMTSLKETFSDASSTSSGLMGLNYSKTEVEENPVYCDEDDAIVDAEKEEDDREEKDEEKDDHDHDHHEDDIHDNAAATVEVQDDNEGCGHHPQPQSPGQDESVASPTPTNRSSDSFKRLARSAQIRKRLGRHSSFQKQRTPTSTENDTAACPPQVAHSKAKPTTSLELPSPKVSSSQQEERQRRLPTPKSSPVGSRKESLLANAENANNNATSVTKTPKSSSLFQRRASPTVATKEKHNSVKRSNGNPPKMSSPTDKMLAAKASTPRTASPKSSLKKASITPKTTPGTPTPHNRGRSSTPRDEPNKVPTRTVSASSPVSPRQRRENFTFNATGAKDDENLDVTPLSRVRSPPPKSTSHGERPMSPPPLELQRSLSPMMMRRRSKSSTGSIAQTSTTQTAKAAALIGRYRISTSPRSSPGHGEASMPVRSLSPKARSHETKSPSPTLSPSPRARPRKIAKFVAGKSLETAPSSPSPRTGVGGSNSEQASVRCKEDSETTHDQPEPSYLQDKHSPQEEKTSQRMKNRALMQDAVEVKAKLHRAPGKVLPSPPSPTPSRRQKPVDDRGIVCSTSSISTTDSTEAILQDFGKSSKSQATASSISLVNNCHITGDVTVKHSIAKPSRKDSAPLETKHDATNEVETLASDSSESDIFGPKEQENFSVDKEWVSDGVWQKDEINGSKLTGDRNAAVQPNKPTNAAKESLTETNQSIVPLAPVAPKVPVTTERSGECFESVHGWKVEEVDHDEEEDIIAKYNQIIQRRMAKQAIKASTTSLPDSKANSNALDVKQDGLIHPQPPTEGSPQHFSERTLSSFAASLSPHTALVKLESKSPETMGTFQNKSGLPPPPPPPPPPPRPLPPPTITIRSVTSHSTTRSQHLETQPAHPPSSTTDIDILEDLLQSTKPHQPPQLHDTTKKQDSFFPANFRMTVPRQGELSRPKEARRRPSMTPSSPRDVFVEPSPTTPRGYRGNPASPQPAGNATASGFSSTALLCEVNSDDSNASTKDGIPPPPVPAASTSTASTSATSREEQKRKKSRNLFQKSLSLVTSGRSKSFKRDRLPEGRLSPPPVSITPASKSLSASPARSTTASSPLAVITKQSFSVAGSKVDSPKRVHWKPKTKVTISQRRAAAMCQAADEYYGKGENISLGATWQDIVQIPSRTLTPQDMLCSRTSARMSPSNIKGAPLTMCYLCTKSFRATEVVRTLRCSHNFHLGCIDKFLFEQAECPICARPAVMIEI